MCLTPCSVAIEFSILRATSVSSWAGEAPGSVAVVMIVGRSMSGKFWIFIDRKLIRPRIVSMMNSSTAGTGFWIDQRETLMAMVVRSTAGEKGLRPRRRGDRGRRIDDAHQVAVGEEAAALGDDAGVGGETGDDL